MTPEEFAKKYGMTEKISYTHGQYPEMVKVPNTDFLSDLRSVIRGETSELLKQRDELLEKIKELELMINKGLGWMI